MLVKICGIQTREAAAAAVQGGADFIGFVFAKSKREITPDDARKIAQDVPDSVKKVGVFVNETIENMKQIAEHVGLDVIQLHGDEPEETAEQLPYETIKAFHATEEAFEEIARYPADYILLDTPSDKVRGGTGKAFDWSLLDKVNFGGRKIILAGGLSPENVKEGIDKVSPSGVDVSSGVETEGKKDIAKIQQFIKNAKQQRKEEI